MPKSPCHQFLRIFPKSHIKYQTQNAVVNNTQSGQHAFVEDHRHLAPKRVIYPLFRSGWFLKNGQNQGLVEIKGQATSCPFSDNHLNSPFLCDLCLPLCSFASANQLNGRLLNENQNHTDTHTNHIKKSAQHRIIQHTQPHNSHKSAGPPCRSLVRARTRTISLQGSYICRAGPDSLGRPKKPTGQIFRIMS